MPKGGCGSVPCDACAANRISQATADVFIRRASLLYDASELTNAVIVLGCALQNQCKWMRARYQLRLCGHHRLLRRIRARAGHMLYVVASHRSHDSRVTGLA